jgi:hypothetical protein
VYSCPFFKEHEVRFKTNEHSGGDIRSVYCCGGQF